MQNVPQTSIADAGKVQFTQVNSQSSNGMSEDLFGQLMAHHANKEQYSYVPASEVDTSSVEAENPHVETASVARQSNMVDSAASRAEEATESAAAAANDVSSTASSTAAAAAAAAATGAEEASEARPAKQHKKDVQAKKGEGSDEKPAANGSESAGAAKAKKPTAPKEAAAKAKSEKADVDMDDMREVLVTLEDLAGMKDQLLKYGLSEKDVQKLVEQAGSAEGLTWGRMISFISMKLELQTRGVDLSAGQRQELMTFFQKLGISAADSEKMVEQVARGDVDQVLAKLDRQIRSLDPDQLKGLDLTEAKEFLTALRKLKAQGDSNEMGMLRTISKAMEKAVERIRDQYVESNRTATAEQGTKSIADPKLSTDIKDAARMADHPPVGKEVAQAAAESATRAIRVLEPAEQSRAALDQAMDRAAESLQTHAGDKPADTLLSQQQAKGDKESDAFNDFMGKMRQDAESQAKAAKTAATADTLSAKESMAQSMAQVRENFNAALDRLDAPKVMRQVQDAILTNLSQGRKQISLQLEPAHLGKLSIVLTANKNGEVQATIRADNHDSAKLIAENLDSIRHHMEAQGIKVSKLEVQTQLSQYQGNNSWYGEAGHNQAREQEAQSRTLNRWRTLRNSGVETNANLQAATEAARQAALGNSGLHVVA